jgi:peptidyl-prolyl cis-trans isomerase SurA
VTLQMRLKIVFFLLQCIATFSFAQQDSVLLRINGKQILRSEFEYKLNKDHKSDLKGKLLKAYLNRYIDNQLKINVAECAGIDTTQTIREQLNDYSKQLVRAYLSNGQTDEDYARALYDKLSKRDDRREVQIVQIYKYLSQNAQ